MGMQQFIRNAITIREKYEQEKKVYKCPSCGRDEKSFFRNIMSTLECMCGVKFYGR
jgi:ribosomal protein L37AE/L43A